MAWKDTWEGIPLDFFGFLPGPLIPLVQEAFKMLSPSDSHLALLKCLELCAKVGKLFPQLLPRKQR